MDAVNLLETRGLSKIYGGVEANRDVDFTLPEGRVTALIGPNGAGKSTFVGMVSGRTLATRGQVFFKGNDISALPAHERIRLGMAYTFQITSIFPRLTVHENVALAARRLLVHDPAALQARITQALDKVDLLSRAERIAGDLSYGHQRLLEIAMGLAQKPQLFILDEPTQGLSEAEVSDFIELIKSLAGEATVLLIEHNMHVVMNTADRITVLDQGTVLANGTPAEIRDNQAVQAAYLVKPMLEVRDIHAAYGDVKVLHGVSFDVKTSEILCLLGRNGAGKTTALRTIMGLLPLSEGTISLEGEDLSQLPPHQIPQRGVGYIPQGRRLFSELTVDENIEIGLMTRKQGPDTKAWVLDLFPRLKERLKQTAGTLSGGEQQMLVTARALCLRPKVLLLDEPTEGLQPSMIELIRDVIVKMKAEGFAIVLVEQRVDAVLSIADRVVFFENGKLVQTSDPSELLADRDILARYLGV